MNFNESKKNIYFWVIFFVLIITSISITAYKDFVLQDIEIVGEEENVINDTNTTEENNVLDAEPDVE